MGKRLMIGFSMFATALVSLLCCWSHFQFTVERRRLPGCEQTWCNAPQLTFSKCAEGHYWFYEGYMRGKQQSTSQGYHAAQPSPKYGANQGLNAFQRGDRVEVNSEDGVWYPAQFIKYKQGSSHVRLKSGDRSTENRRVRRAESIASKNKYGGHIPLYGQQHSNSNNHYPKPKRHRRQKTITLDTIELKHVGLREVVRYTKHLRKENPQLPDLNKIFKAGLEKAKSHVKAMTRSSQQDLTNIEAVAINFYAQEDPHVYDHLNCNLRKYQGDDPKTFGNGMFANTPLDICAGNYQPYLEIFIRACKKLDPKNGKMLYRGVYAKEAWITKFKKGRTVPLVAVKSYSEDEDVAKFFASRKAKCQKCDGSGRWYYFGTCNDCDGSGNFIGVKVIFELYTKSRKSRAFGINKFSPKKFKAESEAVVMPGTNVKVLDRYTDGGYVCIILEEK